MKQRSLFLALMAVAVVSVAQDFGGERVETAQIARGDLLALFRDNSQSPEILSGVQSLFHVRHARQFDAFDPDSRGASAGLNFEHIIFGHANAANRFTPRHGTYTLYRLADGSSVVLVRERQDSPWAVGSSFKYTLNEPHYIDVDFRCRA